MKSTTDIISKNTWIPLFQNNGFNPVQGSHANVNGEFPGTLIVFGVLDPL